MIIPDIDLLSLIFALYSTITILVAAGVVSGLFLVFLRYTNGRAALLRRLSSPRDIRLAMALLGVGWLLMAFGHLINCWFLLPGFFCFLAAAFVIRIVRLATPSTSTHPAVKTIVTLSVLTAPLVILLVAYLANVRAPWFLFR